MQHVADGILIAFEGIDGSGKTTQARMLVEALSRSGEIVVASKEPTDGNWGQKVRLSAHSGRMGLEEELEAFVEDRKEHVRDVISPALERGHIVVLDRYFYSTISYQGIRGANIVELENTMRLLFPVPDLVFLLDLEPEIGLQRISKLRGETPNKFERKTSLKHIRQIFLKLAAKDEEVKLVDATPSIESVYQTITQMLGNGPLKRKRPGKTFDWNSLISG